jgi:hypothetical protein
MRWGLSHKATYWAFRQKLPALQKIVLIVLADRHNGDTGRCDPSIARVAEDCGMSSDSVRNAIKALRGKGLLEAHERFDGPTQLTNFYTFNFKSESTPPLDNSHPPTRQKQGPPLDNSHPNRELELVNEHVPLLEKPTKKIQNFSTPLPTWISKEVWAGFVEMRKKIKHPLTERAIIAAFNKLDKFRQDGHDPNQLLDEATLNNWRGIWLPKEWPGNQSTKPNPLAKMNFMNVGPR